MEKGKAAGPGRFAVWRGLCAHLRGRIVGQDEAMAALADALLAGEMGHTPAGRPRSLILILGPTGTGKTKAVLEASRHLFGTDAIARVNVGEFASADRVPLLLGTAAGERGILGGKLSRLRDAGGRILLLDEIEKAHRTVSDLFLGMEAAEITLANGESVDLSDFHIVATSNLGSADAIEMEGVARASIRRHLEQEASSHFRPEVFARFTAVVACHPLTREAQLEICRQILEEETSLQSAVLSRRFRHAHCVLVGPGARRRLVSEGYHRRLGARPMRNTIERRVRGALVDSQLRGVLGPGVRECVLLPGEREGLRVALTRTTITL